MYVEADSVTTVNESARANVSLVCKVLHGNPKNLTDVQWFFNNKKMFDNGNSSTLVLENVRREHHGNYSCRGQTTAGWGFTSALKEVFVQCKHTVQYIKRDSLQFCVCLLYKHVRPIMHKRCYV